MNSELTLDTAVIIDLDALKAIAEGNRREMEDSAKMISRYRHEKVTNKDYNGRQLLELIQNADDAGSDFVSIVLDTKNKNLQVINTGNSFTLEGFRSLMIPNLSPKRKKTYIGNKGLGFRSVLNWSRQVKILSAGVSVQFSLDLAKKEFDKLYPDTGDKKAVLEEFQYSPEVIPYPVFAVPDIEGNDLPPQRTIIEITYLDDTATLKSIRDQLEDLRKEVLLFLNHITEIVLVDDGSQKIFKAAKAGNQTTIGDSSWTIFDNKEPDGEDPVLPEDYRDPETTEVESYSLKIAVQKNLKDNICRLFSFFPTKVGLNFPAVIHGTFELDSSRNQIIESPKNTFLVERLLELMYKVCLTIEDLPEHAGWNRLRFLDHKGQRDPEFARLGFYDAIDNWLKQAAVLPGFDQQFKSISGVKILTGEFASVVGHLARAPQFPELLLEIPADLTTAFARLYPNYYSAYKYSVAELKSRIEAASLAMSGNVSAEDYALWIAAVKTLFPSKSNERIKILYGDDYKLAGSDVSLFTPSEKSEIDIPPHVKMFYLHEKLYTTLLNRLRVNGDTIPRKFRDEIDNFTNIFPFEPAQVLEKIVSETIAIVERPISPEEKRKTVRAMLKSLYGYYTRSESAKRTTISNANIPIISATGAIIMTRDSFLSEKYPTGIKRGNILGSLYSMDEQIGDPETLGIANDAQTEAFLVDFIKVNRFVIIEKNTERTKYDLGYNEFVFERKGGKPDRFREARISYSSIKNYNQLEQALSGARLSREKMIAWVCLDPEIKTIVESSSDTEFYYNLVNANNYSWPSRIWDAPSYISFQLRRLIGLNNYVLDNEGITFLNDFTIDSDADCFKLNEISKSRIKDVLRQLGAKSDFSELDIERVEAILRKMPVEDPKGKQARKIYLLCTEKYKNNSQHLRSKYGLKLHASLGDKRDYFPYYEVYYARTIGLPKRITNEKPILNFPKRGNETSVVNFFGVQTFDNLDFKSDSYVLNHLATKELNAYLKLLRPFILLRRLTKSKNISEAVRTLKTLTINICSSLTYNINGEIKEADNYDFVLDRNDKQNWLVRYNGSPLLEAMKRDSFLSDVISEIYSIVFDLANLTDDIRTIYRDDYKDTRRRIALEYGEEELLNITSKLEVSDNERSFWSVIYSILHINHSIPSIEDERDFRKQIAATLQIDRSLIRNIDFEDLSSDKNLPLLKTLFERLKATVSDVNNQLQTPINFTSLHKEQIVKFIDNHKDGITSALWHSLSARVLEEKKTFIKKLSEIAEETAKVVAPEFGVELDPDYEPSVYLHFNDRYGISGPFPAGPFTNHLDLFAKNGTLIGCTRVEQTSILTEHDRSVLYFELPDEELQRIRKIIEKNNHSANPQQPSAPADSSTPISVFDMPEAGPNANRNPPNYRGPNRGGYRGSYNTKDDETKNKLGLKAELAVKTSLEGKIYEWLSGYSDRPEKSDNWGFDFRFKNNLEDDWNYAEVKWFESGILYFTDNEYRAAMKYPANYFLYLVNSSGIQMVQFSKLLDESGELDFNGNYFYIEVSEYRFRKLT